MTDEFLLKMQGIDKSFPGVHALDHVDLNVRAGTVHSLMGENGAGKSTLMKVLIGMYIARRVARSSSMASRCDYRHRRRVWRWASR